MSTTYATLNTNITKGIRNHLMEVDALPPTLVLSALASEIAEIVFAELSNVGLTKETIDGLDQTRDRRVRTAQSAA